MLSGSRGEREAPQISHSRVESSSASFSMPSWRCRLSNPEPQGAQLFLDLRCDGLGGNVVVGIPLQLGAKGIDQIEPAVPRFDTARHT